MTFCDEDGASFPDTEFVKFKTFLVHVIPAHPEALVASGGHTTSGRHANISVRRGAVGEQWLLESGAGGSGDVGPGPAPRELPAPAPPGFSTSRGQG